MYISDITDLIDDDGDISQEMLKAKRELASFLALIIDELTRSEESDTIRCFNKGCQGFIRSEYIEDDVEPDIDEIIWKCSECENEGKIIGWQGTKWDNR